MIIIIMILNSFCLILLLLYIFFEANKHISQLQNSLKAKEQGLAATMNNSSNLKAEVQRLRAQIENEVEIAGLLMLSLRSD